MRARINHPFSERFCMKKFLAAAIAVITVMCCVINAAAIVPAAYSVTVTNEDSSGNAYILYIVNPSGHYDSQTDTATVYITNTSGHDIGFEMSVGWAGSTVKTDITTGKVKVSDGVTARFSVSGLKGIPEKANDDLGYVPDSHLSEGSVVRISLTGFQAGDTFTVSGINIGSTRNTSFKETNAAESVVFDAKSIENAKNVIADEEEEPKPTEEFGIVLTQPSNETVTKFIIIVAASAGLFVGGAAIYICSMIIRRRKDAGN